MQGTSWVTDSSRPCILNLDVSLSQHAGYASWARMPQDMHFLSWGCSVLTQANTSPVPSQFGGPPKRGAGVMFSPVALSSRSSGGWRCRLMAHVSIGRLGQHPLPFCCAQTLTRGVMLPTVMARAAFHLRFAGKQGARNSFHRQKQACGMCAHLLFITSASHVWNDQPYSHGRYLDSLLWCCVSCALEFGCFEFDTLTLCRFVSLMLSCFHGSRCWFAFGVARCSSVWLVCSVLCVSSCSHIGRWSAPCVL